MVEVTDADREAVHAWMREQSTGLRMMMTKPRGLYEAFARHRLAEREAVIAWLLSDAARLDYEASGSEEHVLWWAADQFKAGEHLK